MNKRIFYISDPHFGHANVIRMCNRPFADVNEMNETIIERWNSRVNGHDTVYILGDLFFRCDDPESILRRLKGRKHLVIGNHDGSWMDSVPLADYFESAELFTTFTDGKRVLTLCHFPLLTWKHEKRSNSFMIHGHIHNDTSRDFWPLLCARERVLNAGVDINGFMPVTIEELLANNQAFKEAHRQQTDEPGNEDLDAE